MIPPQNVNWRIIIEDDDGCYLRRTDKIVTNKFI